MTRPAATAAVVADDARDDTAGRATSGVVPPDTFGIRVAIARTYLGYNYDRLSDACRKAGTPIDSETFRRWELGMSQCKHPERVAAVLAKIRPTKADKKPLRADWILHGGPLPPEQIASAPAHGQEVLDHWRELSDVA